ncbi:GNAT family N-acetyltransferase [Saccharomonospora azurea]|uniref:GNAT family N-acetyltransferase n=1 Tax=Saccharomonospora azurea TaxID=40988 RepID=UPI003D8BEB9E
MSDGASIVYAQDVFVHPDCQRHGVGRRLVTTLLDHYPRCPAARPAHRRRATPARVLRITRVHRGPRPENAAA